MVAYSRSVAQQAKIWWYENCERVYKKYNICGIDSSTDGGGKKVCDGGLDGKDQGIVCLLNLIISKSVKISGPRIIDEKFSFVFVIRCIILIHSQNILRSCPT